MLLKMKKKLKVFEYKFGKKYLITQKGKYLFVILFIYLFKYEKYLNNAHFYVHTFVV